MMYRYAFQSTLPARGATWTTLSISPRRRFQSTLPARGATPQDIKTKNIKADFNPRSPHGERRRRTSRRRTSRQISIHAPRTGSDSAPAFAPDAAEHFNPRSPHGERPEDDIEDSRLWVFQSTLPARGATRLLTFWTTSGQISIHAPRTGSDAELAFVAQLGKISIHAPRTGSDLALDIDDDVDFISIHAPRTGSDDTP